MSLKFIIFIVTLSVGNCYSQTSGRVTYAVVLDEDTNKDKDPEIEAIRDVAKKQTFSLQFNSDLSQFTSNENLNVNPFYNKMAYVSYTCGYDFFYDKTSKLQLFRKQGNTLIQSKSKSVNWVITSETKLIDKYLCFKAEYNLEYLAADNVMKKRSIVAWFAPSIPFPFGPKEYYGLPGLILELKEWDTVFIATKIELSENLINISFPKGKVISEVEYDQRVGKY